MEREPAILAFVRSSIRSAWALELLLLLQRDAAASWTVDALVRELRGSEAVVRDALRMIEAANLIAADNEAYQYRPNSPEAANLVTGLAELYAQKPIAVLQTIFTAPNDKIRSFADAFLFKKPEK